MDQKTFRYTSWRKLIAQMKTAATFFPEDVPAKDLKQAHFRDAKAKMHKQYAPRTVRNLMSAALELIRYFYKEHLGDAPVPRGIEEACSVAKVTRTDIHLYSVEEIRSIISGTAGTISQMDVMLALNCGMYPQDIGRLELSEIDLTDGSVFWDREKEPKNPFRLHHILWPETLALVKRYMNQGGARGTPVLDYRDGPKNPVTLDPSKLAFLERNKPRYWATPSGHEKDWVTKRFSLTLKGVSFRDLRKSANQLLLDTIEGEGDRPHAKATQEMSDHFLGHKSNELVRTYRLMKKRTYIRMNRCLKELGDHLRAEGVFQDISIDPQQES